MAYPVWEKMNSHSPWKLKADRPHPHNYPPTPTDYRHTDKHLRLRGRTYGRTDGCYQVHYLPGFAVDKNIEQPLLWGKKESPLAHKKINEQLIAKEKIFSKLNSPCSFKLLMVRLLSKWDVRYLTYFMWHDEFNKCSYCVTRELTCT